MEEGRQCCVRRESKKRGGGGAHGRKEKGKQNIVLKERGRKKERKKGNKQKSERNAKKNVRRRKRRNGKSKGKGEIKRRGRGITHRHYRSNRRCFRSAEEGRKREREGGKDGRRVRTPSYYTAMQTRQHNTYTTQQLKTPPCTASTDTAR
jgi:hypothetical protein